MNPEEIKDYQLLKKIQNLCDETKEWDGPVSFENVWQACSNEIGLLKVVIGERIIMENVKQMKK